MNKVSSSEKVAVAPSLLQVLASAHALGKIEEMRQSVDVKVYEKPPVCAGEPVIRAKRVHP